MSLTIVTNNNIDFYTNINSEHLLGKLCRKVNAKHHYYNGYGYEYITIAFEMSEEECLDAANKLKSLLNKVNDIFIEYKYHFDKSCNSECLKYFILEYIEIFEKCGGYKCID